MDNVEQRLAAFMINLTNALPVDDTLWRVSYSPGKLTVDYNGHGALRFYINKKRQVKIRKGRSDMIYCLPKKIEETCLSAAKVLFNL